MLSGRVRQALRRHSAGGGLGIQLRVDRIPFPYLFTVRSPSLGKPVPEWRRLTLRRFAMPTQVREHPVDLVNRKGLGIKIVADPVEHFFVPFVVGVVEGLYQVVEPWNASTIFRWTRELTIRADRIRGIRINWKPFLQDDAVLPAIAKIIQSPALR